MPPSVKPETAEDYFRAAKELKKSGQLYTATIAYQQALAMKQDYSKSK